MADKTDDEKPVKKKVADPAIRCLATCHEALAALDDAAAQRRVMNWLAADYAPAEAGK